MQVYPDACGNPATVPWQGVVGIESDNDELLYIVSVSFLVFFVDFHMILVSFWLPFDAFWCLLAPFWHPWAPFWRPWAPSWNNDPSGANWGRIRGPNRSSFWVQFSHFLVKNRFWAVFFDVPFSEAFFYRFLAAPGYPETMKIKQNPCSVARNQGLAKIEKTVS